MMPSTMHKIAKQAHREPVDPAARRAVEEAGGDPIQAALALGRAMGRNDERSRRRVMGKPILDTLAYGDHDLTKHTSTMNRAYTDKSCRQVRHAVLQVFGDVEVLNTANALIEVEAYKIGFAAAMRLLAECGIAIAEGREQAPETAKGGRQP